MSRLHFYFDPVCPFAWMTSQWVRSVARQRDFDIEWRFVSLRMINALVDYEAQFPPEYEAGHTAGLRLLRVAARTRAEHGPAAVGELYQALGHRIFDSPPSPGADRRTDPRGTAEYLRPVLGQVGLPESLSEALEDDFLDAVVRAETDEALALAGRDVGTPILHFDPPEGVAFFGPVISRLPAEEEAVELWDHVLGLARFPGFAELKRSLRERPQLQAMGVAEGAVGLTEDWHGGSRRTHR